MATRKTTPLTRELALELIERVIDEALSARNSDRDDGDVINELERLLNVIKRACLDARLYNKRLERAYHGQAPGVSATTD